MHRNLDIARAGSEATEHFFDRAFDPLRIRFEPAQHAARDLRSDARQHCGELARESLALLLERFESLLDQLNDFGPLLRELLVEKCGRVFKTLLVSGFAGRFHLLGASAGPHGLGARKPTFRSGAERMTTLADDRIGLLFHKGDLAFFFQRARRGDQAILRGFHVFHSHRPERFHLFLQAFGGAARHAREESLLQRFARGLERNREIARFDFPEDALEIRRGDAAEIIEGEHFPADRRGRARRFVRRFSRGSFSPCRFRDGSAIAPQPRLPLAG